AAGLLRDGTAPLPRPARAVHDQRHRGAGVVFRELPDRARSRPGPRVRDGLHLLRRDGHDLDPGRADSRLGEHPPTPAAADRSADVPARRDVSVVVVTYNAMPWIERCLDSVSGYDTVVVDNGSTDGTLELVRERFPPVRFVEQEN